MRGPRLARNNHDDIGLLKSLYWKVWGWEESHLSASGKSALPSPLIFLARLLILIKKGGLLQLKFGVVGVGVGVNIYLWAR